MATINLPFAASATRRAPTSDELENGFSCGDADKQLFDWLAWWETAQIARAISASGLAVDDADIDRLARAIQLGSNYVVATGTANAWTVGPSLAPLAYAAGLPFDIVAPASNSSTGVTANVASLGTKSIKRSDGADPQVGDLVAGTLYRTVYDGTNIRISGQLPSQAREAALKVTRTLITTPGSWSFTVPGGVYSIDAFPRGAGAGGGGADAGTPGGAASGGSAGSECPITLAVSPGDVLSGVIGAGGAGGTNGTVNGSNGGATTLIHNGVTYTAGGGIGGLSAAAGVAQNARTGGTPTNGDSRSRPGAPSKAGTFSNNGTQPVATGGDGGSSPGGGLGGSAGAANGNPGLAPGGGGGGAGGTSGSNQTGGAGARGEVLLVY